MLRMDKRARFEPEGAWFWRRYRFHAGKFAAARPVRPQVLADQEALQREQPVALIEADGRRWWWFRDCFYIEDDGLTAHDVMALVVERERRRRRKLDRAHAALRQDMNGTPRREPIPRAIRLAVWERDGGPVRGVREHLRAPVRPRHPGRARWRHLRREPAAAVRGLQPVEGRLALRAR